MQTVTNDPKVVHSGIVGGEDSGSEIEKTINAMVTTRIVEFYRHLVESGSIKPVSADGPTCGLSA